LNVAKFSANLVAGYRFTKNFRAHGHLCFYGSQDSYQIDLSTGTTLYSEATIPARAILDVGASYDIKPVTFSFNVHNLFNTTYYQGGLSARALRQQGLWFIGDVSVKF
jgi:outer membrane receptor protein involved in Fe transport